MARPYGVPSLEILPLASGRENNSTEGIVDDKISVDAVNVHPFS